jgi:hypothetical protein
MVFSKLLYVNNCAAIVYVDFSLKQKTVSILLIDNDIEFFNVVIYEFI